MRHLVQVWNDATKATFLPRDAMLARYMYDPVSVSVCLSVTSRSSIEAVKRIELVSAWELSLTYTVI